MLKFLVLPVLIAAIALGIDVVKAGTVAFHAGHQPLP